MKTGYGYVNKHNDHDYKADGFKELKKMRSNSATGAIAGANAMSTLRKMRKKSPTGSGSLSDKEYNRYRN